MLIEFHGANKELDEYTERGDIWVNPERISAVYDHTILLDGHKIRVMETIDEIIGKIGKRED